MECKEFSITNIPAISAIYFALLQWGYDFYPIDRDALTLEKLCSFIVPAYNAYDFFSEAKQSTIYGIHWHFKLNCYFYIIKVNGKVKSKRYYDDDLNFVV